MVIGKDVLVGLKMGWDWFSVASGVDTGWKSFWKRDGPRVGGLESGEFLAMLEAFRCIRVLKRGLPSWSAVAWLRDCLCWNGDEGDFGEKRECLVQVFG